MNKKFGYACLAGFIACIFAANAAIQGDLGIGALAFPGCRPPFRPLKEIEEAARAEELRKEQHLKATEALRRAYGYDD